MGSELSANGVNEMEVIEFTNIYLEGDSIIEVTETHYVEAVVVDEAA
jgi:hypothetical protein